MESEIEKEISYFINSDDVEFAHKFIESLVLKHRVTMGFNDIEQIKEQMTPCTELFMSITTGNEYSITYARFIFAFYLFADKRLRLNLKQQVTTDHRKEFFGEFITSLIQTCLTLSYDNITSPYLVHVIVRSITEYWNLGICTLLFHKIPKVKYLGDMNEFLTLEEQ